MRYVVDPSRVSHDRLQDEVIIINMASGAYYSGSGTAADVWTLISQGATIAEATRILASEYTCEETIVARDVDKCVGLLVKQGLVQESAKNYESKIEFALPQSVRRTWTLPEFDEYTDMWDLIRFDPIHEVGDDGWPFAAPIAKI